MATVETILDAAEELFAARGFKAATIKEIGLRAQTNPALLFYYFPDKAGLYQAVLVRIGAALRDGAVARLEHARSADQIIEAIVGAQTDLLIRHPKAPSLIIREMMDHDAAHALPMFHQFAGQLFRPLADAIDRGKATGAIRADLDARFATVSTLSQLVYYTLAQPVIRVLLDQGPSYPTPEDVKAFGAHAADFAIAGMRGPVSSMKSK